LNPRFHNDVISKVKKTIRKFSQTQSQKNSQPDYLVKMNIPPLMGRRDAAYDRVETLLSDNLFAHSENERKEIYLKAVELLNIVLKDTENILIAVKQDDRESREERLLSYFELLRNIIQAACDMVNYEMCLFKDETNLNKLIGESVSNNLRKTDEIFSESEMSIVQKLGEFFENAATQIQKYREYAQKSFSRHNTARYRKSFKEYTKIYEQYKLEK
jgi:hypothetical protein